jgi:hypothetical protein
MNHPEFTSIKMKNEHKGHNGSTKNTKTRFWQSNMPGLFLILDAKLRQRLTFVSFVLPLGSLC